MRFFKLFISFTLILAMVSCMDEEKFETGSNDRLAFSIDTLRFDTVISEVGTPTKYFMVYNRNSNGVSITNVSFLNGESNGYRVNVDGIYINEGLSQSIDCRKDDSLRVFVELTPEASDTDTPVERAASLVFTLANGLQQSVRLIAYSQDVINLTNVHISSDTTLSAKRPYVIFDSLTVEEGATLTLAAGTKLYFHNNTGMEVYGTLKAEGTLEQPIVFRGDRTDLIFVNQPYDRIPNQWKGIHFATTSYENKLNYCDIHSGGDGIVCDSSDISREKLRMENSIVHNMGGDCFRNYAAKVFVGNSQLSNAAGNCVTLYGGDCNFVHCTVANFYPFDALRGSALVFSNELHNTIYPILNASFYNCILTGYSSDEIYGTRSVNDPNAAFNYRFDHCLLNTPEVTDAEHFINCTYDKQENDVCREDNFHEFNTDYLIYTFGLVEKSPARDIGDISLTSIYYPVDRNGITRLSDGKSDAGCYEYQPTE